MLAKVGGQVTVTKKRRVVLEGSRDKILGHLAGLIHAVRRPHPSRIGLDGPTGGGKTTLARELVNLIEKNGRPCIGVSLDSFHNPKRIRYQSGRYSATGFYSYAHDLQSVIDYVLKPLGPDGNRVYRKVAFDLKADAPIEDPPQTASRDSVLILEGGFALRQELRPFLDYGVYVYVDHNTAVKRAIGRDGEVLAKAIRERYLAAHDIHNQRVGPELNADICIDNSVLDRPVLYRYDSAASWEKEHGTRSS